MQLAFPGQSNIVTLPLASLSDNGAAVETGTVNFYLKDLDQDKYWNATGSLYEVTKVSAGVASHDTDGFWNLSIASGAWTDEHRYRLSAGHDVKTLVAMFDFVLCSRVSKFLQADKVIDSTVSPWQLVYKDKDTGVELMRQTMRNPSDEAINDVDNILGKLEKV